MGFRPCSGPLIFHEHIHLGSLSAPASFRFKEFVDFVLNFFTTLAVLATAAAVYCFVDLPITFYVILPAVFSCLFFSCGKFESNACSLTPLAFPLALASYLFICNTFFDQVRHCKHAVMILILLVHLVMENCAESFYGCIMTTFFANNVVNLCINFFVNG